MSLITPFQEQSLAFDRQHIWHPYTSMNQPSPVFMVTDAEGVYLQLADGRKVIDGMASWWSVIHGYKHPRLNQAAQQQLNKFSHVMFGGLTHQPAIELAKRLVQISPDGLDRVFFSDSGSVSVEVAIKMAIQYQQSLGRSEKHRLMSLRRGYHGDTFAAMSVCDPVTGMHQLFKGTLSEQVFLPAPQSPWQTSICQDDLTALEETFAKHHHEVAAFILEPIVQGAGGMRFYSADYLRHARRLCDQYDVLMIADEIATGFGRTGALFACQYAQITPDILCLGKALTGGYLTLAATLTKAHIAEVISSSGAGCFMHGPTFMANPLACAIACESIDLLLEQDWQTKIEAIETQLKHHLEPASQFPQVAEVRYLGAIGVIELHHPVNLHQVQPWFVDAGVWVRPFGKLVYIMPPYIIQPAELKSLCESILTVIQRLD